MKPNEILYKYILLLGDNAMILGHRMSELCGHGPNLETDIACTNISLDLFGQVRNYFQYAAEIKGGDASEDAIAYFRNEREFYNAVLVEHPNVDFAYIIVRQYLYDVYSNLLLEELEKSKDERLAAIATKSLKESKYHLIFSSQWFRRLADGTETSKAKVKAALDDLYPLCHELVSPVETETMAHALGLGPDVASFRQPYFDTVHALLEETGMEIPSVPPRVTRGKEGLHTEKLGYILAEFQSVQRAYPNLAW